jgi:rifampicin phosphotransferase
MDVPAVITSEGRSRAFRLTMLIFPRRCSSGLAFRVVVLKGLLASSAILLKRRSRTGKSIAPSSDPGWTPLVLNAVGMVVEVGARMSHGAIIAREYGLPAVVAVSGATHNMGQRVRINGTQGTVELLETD